MISPKRTGVRFSANTELVLAGLDRSMHVDEKMLQTMQRHGVVIPVNDNTRIRRRLNRAGLPKNMLRDVYLVPMRKPELSGVKSEIHRRSIHTMNPVEGKKLVFKGSGLATSPVSFRFDEHEESRERKFKGGTRAKSIARVLAILFKLEEHFQSAKQNKDFLVKWAEEQHGLNELPVMKHAAVFRPLQFLVSQEESPRFGNKTRVPITSETMAALNLSDFYGQERIHVYSAKEAARIEEELELFRESAVRDLIESPTKVKEVESGILTRFIVRGLLLLHAARSAGISLSKRGASPFYRRNASYSDFFDFGGAEVLSREEFARYEQEDCDALASTVKALAFKLAGRKNAGYQSPTALKELVRSAARTANDASLPYEEFSHKLNRKITRIVKLAQSHAERE